MLVKGWILFNILYNFWNQMRKNTFLKIFSWTVLIACVLVLTKNILFKKSPRFYKNQFRIETSQHVIANRWKKANKKPFATIGLFYNSRRLNSSYKMNNLAGNIIGFIPLGIFVPFLFRRLRVAWKTVLMVFLISLSFEMTQLVFGLGVFDVDDLILNTLGGLIGYFVFMIAHRIWKRYHTVSYNTNQIEPSNQMHSARV